MKSKPGKWLVMVFALLAAPLAHAQESVASNMVVNAVRKGDLQAYLALINAGTYVDPAAEKLVALAVKSGNLALARQLIDRGADPDVAEELGITPLMLAVGAGNSSMAELLLDKGADLNRRDDSGATALYWAIKEGHKNLIERLILRGAETENVISGTSAIAAAAGHERTEIVEMLRSACRRNCP